MPEAPHFDRVNVRGRLHSLSIKELTKVAEELWVATVEAVSVAGVDLCVGRSVVELTVATHNLFDTPRVCIPARVNPFHTETGDCNVLAGCTVDLAAGEAKAMLDIPTHGKADGKGERYNVWMGRHALSSGAVSGDAHNVLVKITEPALSAGVASACETDGLQFGMLNFRVTFGRVQVGSVTVGCVTSKGRARADSGCTVASCFEAARRESEGAEAALHQAGFRIEGRW